MNNNLKKKEMKKKINKLNTMIYLLMKNLNKMNKKIKITKWSKK